MLEVDKCSDDDKGHENPVGGDDWPRKAAPNSEEQKRGNEFDAEVTKRDSASTVGAASPQHEPADQRQIVVPRNRSFAGRAKRATRFIDRKLQWQAINADVQKRADHRTENKSKRAE